MDLRTRESLEAFLQGLVDTEGEGKIAAFRVDEAPGRVTLQVQFLLRILLVPNRAEGIAWTLYERVRKDLPAGVVFRIKAGWSPLWLRRRSNA